MTVIEPTKPSATSVAAADKAQAKTATNPKAVAHKAEVVTLDQLAREMKMPPRDARMLLRLTVSKNLFVSTLRIIVVLSTMI